MDGVVSSLRRADPIRETGHRGLRSGVVLATTDVVPIGGSASGEIEAMLAMREAGLGGIRKRAWTRIIGVPDKDLPAQENLVPATWQERAVPGATSSG